MASFTNKIIGFGIIAFAAAVLYLNSPLDPPTTIGNQQVIPPNVPVELIEKPSLKGEKGHVKITYIPDDTSLEFDVFDSYLLLPEGKSSLPSKTDSNGNEVQLWKVEHSRPVSFINLGNDFGVYAGALFSKAGEKTRTWDAGIKYAPARFLFNSVSIDLLLSDQSAGGGVSVYPAPERFGYFWKHLGIGAGRVYNYRDDGFSNIIYCTVSTRF